MLSSLHFWCNKFREELNLMSVNKTSVSTFERRFTFPSKKLNFCVLTIFLPPGCHYLACERLLIHVVFNENSLYWSFMVVCKDSRANKMSFYNIAFPDLISALYDDTTEVTSYKTSLQQSPFAHKYCSAGQKRCLFFVIKSGISFVCSLIWAGKGNHCT